MTDRKLRVLLVATHPTQYGAVGYRQMSRHPRLDPLVAFLSLRGAEGGADPEFGMEVKWDVPLLDGYPWVLAGAAGRNGSARAAERRSLWRMIRGGGFDAVVLYTGYRVAAFWQAVAAAKSRGVPVLFGTDTTTLRPRDGTRWKAAVKRVLWPPLFRLADVVIVPSSGSVKMMRELGLPAERVALTPYVVDNDWWTAQAEKADRAAVRASWGVPAEAPVVLFCAKLQPWKRPQDLLRAFAQAAVPGAYLVFVGEGPLRPQLESEARALGVSERVRFPGFANQSALPGIYSAADLLVLPSGYEPFGVVVNEAMLCGCPVAVSDQVGARFDLVREGDTGFVFPAGDVPALAAVLRAAFADRERLRAMGAAARRHLRSWSPRENVAALVSALDRLHVPKKISGEESSACSTRL